MLPSAKPRLGPATAAGRAKRGERSEMGRYRVSMDIGGTFTDVVAYDEDRGTYAAGKASTTPARPDRRRLRRARAGDRLAGIDRFHRPRDDRRPERLPAAAGREGAPACDRGCGRRVPHRPRKSGAALRPPLPEADAARPALGHRRDPGTPRLARRGARAARRGGRSWRPPSARETRDSARSPSRCSSAFSIRSTNCASKRSCASDARRRDDLALASRRSRMARVRAHVVGRRRGLHRAGDPQLPRAAPVGDGAPGTGGPAARHAVERRSRDGRIGAGTAAADAALGPGRRHDGARRARPLPSTGRT